MIEVETRLVTLSRTIARRVYSGFQKPPYQQVEQIIARIGTTIRLHCWIWWQFLLNVTDWSFGL